jgi:hypothetical protein
MHEDVVIEFCPTAWQYYFDTIRIRSSQQDDVVVPIHAYPVMNDLVFPKRVLFRNVERTERCVVIDGGSDE